MAGTWILIFWPIFFSFSFSKKYLIWTNLIYYRSNHEKKCLFCRKIHYVISFKDWAGRTCENLKNFVLKKSFTNPLNHKIFAILPCSTKIIFHCFLRLLKTILSQIKKIEKGKKSVSLRTENCRPVRELFDWIPVFSIDCINLNNEWIQKSF